MGLNKIKYESVEVPIVITYKDAMGPLEELGMDVLNLFQERNGTLTEIMMNDKLMVKVWFHYIKKYESNFDSAIEKLTPEAMVQFREVFVKSLLDFTNPQMRPVIQEALKEIKETLASPEGLLKKLSLESLEEPE